jgi:photosystem I subunit 10
MLFHLHSLIAAVPPTSDWSITTGIVMVLCNVVAIAFGKYTISKQNEGPALPSSEMFGGMGVGALLGTTSFGHILGAGVILGLQNAGVL